MKVIHFAPEMEPGSPDALAADLAYALQEHGVSSVVAAPSNRLLSPIVGKRVKFVRFAEKVIPGPWSGRRRLAGLILSYRPNVLHAYGYKAVAIAIRANLCVPTNQRPRIVGSLSTYTQDADLLRRTKLRECGALTVNHTDLGTWLRGNYSSRIEPRIIPYGVNDSLCYPGYTPDDAWVAHWKSAYPQLEKRFVVCLPAPIAPEYCTQHITPILSMLHSQDIPAHALLVGSTHHCDPEYLRALHQSLRAADMSDFVTQLDPPANLRDVLCMSQAVLCFTEKPVIYHPAALQALALGRPTAGYAHGAVLDYLEAMQPMGVLPVGNVDSAADILSQWYTAPPDPPDEIPYPFKLKDTAKAIYELYTNLNHRTTP